jgi:hypothetical protein
LAILGLFWGYFTPPSVNKVLKRVLKRAILRLFWAILGFFCLFWQFLLLFSKITFSFDLSKVREAVRIARELHRESVRMGVMVEHKK